MIILEKVGTVAINIVKECDICGKEVDDLYSFNAESGEVEVFERDLWITKTTPLQLCEDCLKNMSRIKTATVEVTL